MDFREPAPPTRRKASAKRERALVELANRQHGVLTRKQLVAGGLSVRTVGRRLEAGRLHPLHKGVYALAPGRIERRGEWMAAVLACGEGAILSHRSAAYLWGLMRPRGGPVDVSAARGRQRPGIVVHEGAIADDDRTALDSIPVTSAARTLFDLAEVVSEAALEKAFEEADRLSLLEVRALEEVCARGHGRRALGRVRRLIEAARIPDYVQSHLEERVLDLCCSYGLPRPETGANVLGREVDAFWPRQKLMVEADSWEFHRHRAAFERDRERDAAMLAEGYRVVRLTARRLEQEPDAVAAQLRRMLAGKAGE